MTSTTLRILVVDDNADSGDSLGALLRLRGNTVRVVYNGKSAVTVTPRFRPDVILLDIGMPSMHGYEVCRRLRKTISGRRAAILAVTGWVQPEEGARARAAGFNDHLAKPVALHELLAKIEEHAPRDPPLPPRPGGTRRRKRRSLSS